MLFGTASYGLRVPYFARRELSKRLKACLDQFQLGVDFWNQLSLHEAVIGGSFAIWFMNGGDPSQKPSCIDIFVAEDGLFELDMDMEETFSSYWDRGNCSTREQDHPIAEEHRRFFLNDCIGAVRDISMDFQMGPPTKLRIIESTLPSPFGAIVASPISHTRVALCRDGFFNFHASWGSREESFVADWDPRIRNDFVQKHQDRGVKIRGEFEELSPEKQAVHKCRSSLNCPLTLRCSLDEDCSFIPFTEKAAIRAASRPPTKYLNYPPIQWRHGGRCLAGYEGSETPRVLYAQRNRKDGEDEDKKFFNAESEEEEW